MSGDLTRGDEDQEPEIKVSGRAPAKKSMEEFLAEFEERLKSHPDEPATGALRLVEERAGGLRRSPIGSAPPERAAVDPPGPEADPEPEADPAPEPEPEPAETLAETMVGADPGGASAQVALPEGQATEAATAAGESRRLRGRRRRRHRHRAH